MNNIIFQKLELCDKIIVGLSGGADSVVLTHILYSHFGAKKLVCAHINHGIRGEEAKHDEDFARDFCENLGIEFKVVHLDIPELAKEMGVGEEECGRIKRYEFFNSLSSEKTLIATAHNADDNAETVLLNLIRGCGVKGITGIPVQRENIVRPILDMTRMEIENYAKENNLLFVTDSSNNQNDYSRNKVRNIVLPILREINLNASENIGRSSAIMSDVCDYIYSNAEKILNTATKNSGLDCLVLQNYDQYILSEVVKLFLIKNKINNYEEKHIKEIVKLIFSQGAVMLPKEKIISVKQNFLSLYELKSSQKVEIELKINEENNYFQKIIKINQKNMENPENVNKKLFKTLIDCDTIRGCLTAGSRCDGDYFYPKGRNVKKSLKKLFNEAKIPAHLRDNVVVIKDNDNIVYIEGFGVSEKNSVNENTTKYYTVEIKNL